MPSLPQGLTALLAQERLPAAALLAAAEQRDLHPALARRESLPAAVIERCFVAGALPAPTTASQLVDRPLAARTVRHVLRIARERRPAVLAALAAHNVPAARDRGVLLGADDRALNEAILANRDWPVDEQFGIARRTGGRAALEWLATLDSDVVLTLDDLLDAAPGTRLDADPLIALRALLRRPWLSRLPLRHVGPGLRSAIATVADDERTLYEVLGQAERAAAYGRSSRAATLVEAVACNPSASLAVQRRCKRLARRLRCHYLEDWLPAPTGGGPLWQADADEQRAAMTRLEALAHVRHRTVFSAGVLAATPHLDVEVRARLIAYLDEHLAAVDPDPATAALLADRLQVDDDTRSRWLHACQPLPLCSRGWQPAPTAQPEAPPCPWESLELADCEQQVDARTAVRRLRAGLGTGADAWGIALLLLREGFDGPLAELPAVVGTLLPPQLASA